MKIAILAASGSLYFPFFIDKPKSLYHINGEIQLEKVIKNALQIVNEEDIIIVAGYKYEYMESFLRKYPKIKLKINENYKKPAIYSFYKAIEDENEDIIFIMADESISISNIKRVAESKKEMALLTHDDFYYYSLGIFKLSKNQFYQFNQDYLEWDYIKKIYCFANNKEKFDGHFNINSGICIGYIIIDLVRKIGKIESIENPKDSKNAYIDFFHYNPKLEYVPDIDKFEDTDEYKNSIFLKIYHTIFCKPIIIFRLVLQRIFK